jgi:23S rRNA (cytidine1920-2'-O)/16S rRNA (cytidine1409-2'-O)-methyltransferase
VRLDILLVETGHARSRKHASDLIDAQRVIVDGKPARKASMAVAEDSALKVLDAIDYVSRAGHKLAKALDAFGALEVRGKVALDVGASTGGFTDVLLRRGATKVIALDVGHDQLVPELRENPNVITIEGFNARELSPETLSDAIAGAAADGAPAMAISDQVEVIVADLSFISLTLVLEQLASVGPRADMVLLIKPQFEVGKQSLHASGIVNDWTLRAGAIRQVLDAAHDLGLGVRGLVRSELPGTHGNIEYVLWISPLEPVNRSKWSDRIESLAKEAKS